MVAVVAPNFAVTLELEERVEEDDDEEEEGDLVSTNALIPKLWFKDENHSFKNLTRKSTLTFSFFPLAFIVA